MLWTIMLEGGRLWGTRADPGLPAARLGILLHWLSRPLNGACVFVS